MIRMSFLYGLSIALLCGLTFETKNTYAADTGNAAPSKTVKKNKKPLKKKDSGKRVKGNLRSAGKLQSEKAKTDDPLKTPIVDTTAVDSLPKKKTLVVDARRLKGSKFTETVNYILDHDEVRFKLQNITIEPEFVVSLLKDLEQAKVIDRIRDFSFVITNEKNALLNEQVFVGKILPLVAHAEGLELNCLGVSDKVVDDLVKKLPSLTSLSLFGVGVTDKSITTLATLPRLNKIHLINSNVTGKGVQLLIKKFNKLTAVGLSGQNLLDEDFITLGKAMPTLQTLSMVGQIFKNVDKIKDILGVMRNLQGLDLSETNATDQTARVIVATVKGLKHLDISETLMTGQGVREIAENLDLYTLKMNSLKNTGDDELKMIARHQINLKKFYFAGVDFTNLGVMDVIQNLPSLLEMSLIPSAASQWILTDSIASALVYNLAKLQYLHIQPGRLPEDVRVYLAKERPLLHLEYQP